MKRMMLLAALGTLAFSTAVSAGTCNGEFGWLGKGTAYNLDEGNFIFTGEFSGTFFNTDTSDPTHKMTFQCPGLWHVEGGEGNSNGVCIGKDADGDKLFFTWAGELGGRAGLGPGGSGRAGGLGAGLGAPAGPWPRRQQNKGLPRVPSPNG